MYLVMGVAYGIVFRFGFLGILKIMFSMIFVDYFLTGLVVSTSSW